MSAAYNRGSAYVAEQISREYNARNSGQRRDREAIIDNQREEIALLQAEIERLSSELVAASEVAGGLRSKIDDLQSAVERSELRRSTHAKLGNTSRRREAGLLRQNETLLSVIRLGMTPERYQELLDIVDGK